LLGDGGLCANAPIEVIARELPRREASAVFVLDLYARDGARPDGLQAALARKNDLIFGNQTWLRLAAVARELEARVALARKRGDARVTAPRLFYLSYRAPREEAGPEKPFDLSRASLEGRWRAGFLDMQEALHRFDARDHSEMLAVVRRAE
jgi:NTE family protein